MENWFQENGGTKAEKLFNFDEFNFDAQSRKIESKHEQVDKELVLSSSGKSTSYTS